MRQSAFGGIRDRAKVLTSAGIGSLAVLCGLIVWLVGSWVLDSRILPSPIAVAFTFVDQLDEGLLGHAAVSAYRILVAIAVSTAIAAPLGLIFGTSSRFYTLSAPIIYLSYPIPKIVLLPIVLVVLGLGDASKITMIALILFFQILILVRDEVRTVRPELVLSLRSLGANRLQLLRYVYVPASLPGLFTALRVSTGVSIAVLFFVETIGARQGLGYFIYSESWQRLAYEEMYAGVIAMALLGLGIYYAVDGLERRLTRWNRDDR